MIFIKGVNFHADLNFVGGKFSIFSADYTSRLVNMLALCGNHISWRQKHEKP